MILKKTLYQQAVIALLTCLCLFSSGPIYADATEVDGTPIADPIYRSFLTNYRKYAVISCKIDDGYAVIPKYDRRLESSRGITTTQAMDHLKVEKEERQGNLVRKRVAYPDRADAEAFSKALPDLSIGNYGWVASVEIVKIIDRKQMIVKDLWLVDRLKLRALYGQDKEKSARENNGEPNDELLRFNYGQRIKMLEQQEDRDQGFEAQFRLVGYDTRGLRVGDRWKGINDEGFQVGVAMWEEPEPAEEGERRSRRDNDPRLVLTALESLMREPMTEQDFKGLLNERGMTVAAFVDLMLTMREQDRLNAEERIINSLLPPARDLEDD